MSRKDGMYCYYDWINPLKKVPPEDFKELIIAMLEYHRDGTPPPVFGDITGVVADFIFPQIERSKKYAQNGAKGGVVTQSKTIGLSNGSTNGSTLKHKTNTKTKTKTDTVSPHTPQGVQERFDRFWKEYPKKVGKQAALKAFLKIKPNEQLLQTMRMVWRCSDSLAGLHIMLGCRLSPQKL